MSKKKHNSTKVIRTFSESFKREKVALFEQGKLSAMELHRQYGVNRNMMYKWKKKYGSLPKNERVVIENDSDYLKLLKAHERIEEYQKCVGKMHIQLEYYRNVIDLINKQYKIDAEKKFG